MIGLVTLALTILIVGTIVMWLWNAVMPDVFGLPQLTWIQSLCIYFLAHLLFNSREVISETKTNK